MTAQEKVDVPRCTALVKTLNDQLEATLNCAWTVCGRVYQASQEAIPQATEPANLSEMLTAANTTVKRIDKRITFLLTRI